MGRDPEDSSGGTDDRAADLDIEATLRELSPEKQALLARELARDSGTGTHGITKQARTDEPLACSSAQERLWFLEQVDPGSAAYVMPAAVRFDGPLDEDVLGRCLTEIVRRHEALRINFGSRGGVPVQLVRPPAPVPLPVTDLRELSPEAADEVVHRRYHEEAGRPFDLEYDQLLRAALFRVRDDENVLLLSTHHIVSDGWSLGVLRHELCALYEAFQSEKPSPLPELEIQYADYALWQRTRLESGELAEQVEYWRQRLSGAPVLELPTDKPRRARSARGDAVPLRLDTALMADVDRFAATEHASRFMVLLAAFAVLLWRWSAQEEFVVGVPIANRNRLELEPLVGCFVNTLPLRVDLADDPTFRELLGAVATECVSAYANQDVPFEHLVKEVGADRSTGPVPLVQVLLALRDVPTPEIRLPGLTVSTLDVKTQSTKFDITLDLVPEADGGIVGRAEFSTDLFERDTVQSMVDALQLLLTEGLARPDVPVSRLQIATRTDRLRMIERFSGGGSARPARTVGTLHGLFEHWVDAAPDHTAVAFGDQSLSYRELDERANQLAWYLRDRGVRPEQLVGVSLPRCEQMVIALLGILKAGAGYVPLDPNYPAKRVAYMAGDARAAAVLTRSSVADPNRFRVDDTEPPQLIALDREAPAIAAMSSSRPPGLVDEPNLAYVIYTSGSTGRPKGSANEHGRVVNTMRGVNRAYQLTPDDRMLAISSLNYDMSVYEIFGTLIAGATIVVPSDIETTDPEQLLALLCTQRVTAWSSAPALLDMVVNYAYQRDGMDGLALRVVGLGGDRMPPALPKRLAELVSGVRLLNLAGMTEVSYASTFHEVDLKREIGSIPWGKSFPNHRLYVLDRHGEPTPVGVPGELFIGGAGPGRGYWQRPGVTAERFLPDPFSPEPGGRMYATGDHARFLANGDLDFLGRLDQQVKIRGFRIEVGEVEAILADHPTVNEPVVVAYDDAAGQRRLAAYVTPRGEAQPDAHELRRYLLERLPNHMVPSDYVVLDQLPLLPSGKLDRAALPQPSRSSSDYVAPTDALERILADLLAELLSVERVGVEDDFFELGGHSLLATQAVSRIRDLFLIGLTIPGFLAAGTVRAKAEHLREVGAAEGVDVDVVAELIQQVSGLDESEVRSRLGD